MECRSGRTGGSHPGVDAFQDLSLKAKTYCGVNCSQGLHFPVTIFNGKKDSSSIAQDITKECDLVWYNTII